jgi:hypothetical protein
VNPLKFAHDLARFKQDLIEHQTGPDGLPAVLAGSYLLLLGGLTQASGDPEQVAQAITEAIEFYNRAHEAARRYYAAADPPEGGAEL